jgi:tellurite resistance protein
MRQQSTPTEHVSARDLSPQEAFVSLLIASARADGSVSVHEANSIEQIVDGMQLFRGQSHQDLQQVFTKAADRIKTHGVPTVVQAAAAVVPAELRPTAFAVAVDLMLSDGQLSPKEERFGDELRALLKVERDTAARIIDVLRTKNAG